MATEFKRAWRNNFSMKDIIKNGDTIYGVRKGSFKDYPLTLLKVERTVVKLGRDYLYLSDDVKAKIVDKYHMPQFGEPIAEDNEYLYFRTSSSAIEGNKVIFLREKLQEFDFNKCSSYDVKQVAAMLKISDEGVADTWRKAHY